MTSKKPDYYEIIGVLRDATQEEIKRAYMQAAQRLHPDKNVAIGETELFLEAQQAYETLSNPKRRAQYDATLPPEEKSNSVVDYKVTFSRSNLAKLNEPQLVYALLEVSPSKQTKEIPAPPLNFCLVLDRSTSMQGPKMDLVKETVARILRSLRKDDIFSIVAFSDRAEIVIPATRNPDIKIMEARVRMMQASGATELYHGLHTGLQEMRRSLSPMHINHVVLLTDGHTYGDEQKCLTLAEESAGQNIGISAMGIGGDWNDILLDEIASRTGGSSAYVAQPNDIERLLMEKFFSLSKTFADDIVIEHNAQEDVAINYAFRLQPDGGPIATDTSLRLGPVLRDSTLEALFEFVIQPSASASGSVTLMDGSMKTVMATRPTPVPPIRLRFTRDFMTDPDIELPPPVIINALSRLRLYRLQERARAEVNEGRFDAATTHLQNLATHLLAQGEKQLASTVLLEIENVKKNERLSEEGGKDIKYGTRSFLLSAPKEKR